MDMSEPPIIRVKFVNRGQFSAEPIQWLRQFPNRSCKWGRCHFLFDPNEQDYDWFVAENDLAAKQGTDPRTAIEELACPPEHTLFITREPSSVTTYGSAFLDQFANVLTGQEDWAIRHKGKIHSQPALRWYYGDTTRNQGIDLKDFDDIVSHPPLVKDKVIATMCSAKAQKHTLHHKRLQFTERLCAAIPELDRFGEGFKEIPDKAAALDSYKYHVAIENHQCDHWWTEKLSDAFLGMTLPFYHGAPNANEYFPQDSFIPINIHDFEGSLKIILRAIEDGEYEKRIESIKQARRLVIEEYHTFAVVSKIVEGRHRPNAEIHRGIQIRGKHALRQQIVPAIRIGFDKACIRVRTLIESRRK